MKKTLAVILALTQLLLLCACGSAAQGNSPGGAIAPKEYTLENTAARYTGKSVDFPLADIKAVKAAKHPQGAFVYGTDSAGSGHYFLLNGESAKMREVLCFGNANAEDVAVSPSGALHVLLIDESGSYYILSAADEQSTAVTLALDLRDYAEDMIMGFYACDNGFFLDVSRRIVAVDNAGKIVQDYGEHDGAETVAVFDDKNYLIKIGAQQNPTGALTGGGTVITELNADFSLGQSYAVEPMFTAFYPGENGQLAALMNNTVYTYDMQSGACTALVNTLTSNMETANLVALDGGRFFTLQNGVPYIWQEAPNDEITTLTLATYNLSFDARRAISAFNQSGASCVINTVDYADFDTYDSENTGMTKLATDIISGKAPDIYDLSCFSPENLAAKGLLEDLKPYFKESGAVSYYDILDCVAQNTEFRGGAYVLVPSFDIVTVCGDYSTVGDGWTVEDFAALAAEHPATGVFGGEYSRADFLSHVLCFMKDELYSEEALTCNFTSDNFVSMLKFAADLPESVAMDGSHGEPFGSAYAGERLFMITNLGCYTVDEISLMNAIYSGNARFIGFPTDSGTGIAVNPCAEFAMSSASANKSGVWEFFEFLLSDRVQLNKGMFDGLPAVKSAFEKSIDSQIATAIKTTPGAYGASSEGPVQIVGAEVDEAAMRETIDYLVANADCVADCDETVLNIVLSCAEPFFMGNKTAESAAQDIQSKLGVYLAEQYG